MQKLQLSIPEPCHENWQQMTPTEQGRFCNACAKEVVDFSAMTDIQVLNYFTNLTNEKVCGRALPEQLDRTISRPEAPRKKLFWYWNYLVMFFMFFKGNSAAAQTGSKPATEVSPLKNMDVRGDVVMVEGIKKEDSRVVTGKITDVDGNPVSFASVLIKATRKGVIADINGVYSLRVNQKASLVISGAGFKDLETQVGTQSVVISVMEKNTSPTVEGMLVISGYLGGMSFRNVDEYDGPLYKLKRVAVIQVKDETTGKPIHNADIIVKPGNDRLETVHTDKKGIYKLKGIADREKYDIKISKEGYETNEFTINEYDFKNRKKEWEVLLRKPRVESLKPNGVIKPGEPTIRFRDIASRDTLYIVDGAFVPKNTYIDPDDIEDYSVLQGPAAAALFGPDGANGAFLITTRKAKARDLDTVTVTSSPVVVGVVKKTATTCTTSIMGAMVKGMSIRVQNPVIDSLKSLKTAITGSIKIYPNPVQRNSGFSVALKLKQEGNYSLQLTDASGRVLLLQQFRTNSKNHTEKIMSDSRWAAGMYYIRIFDTKNKLISKSSFIFQ